MVASKFITKTVGKKCCMDFRQCRCNKSIIQIQRQGKWQRIEYVSFLLLKDFCQRKLAEIQVSKQLWEETVSTVFCLMKCHKCDAMKRYAIRYVNTPSLKLVNKRNRLWWLLIWYKRTKQWECWNFCFFECQCLTERLLEYRSYRKKQYFRLVPFRILSKTF